MKINRLLTIISALAVLAGAAGSVRAQNKVANGNFTENAPAYVVWPGYNQDGALGNNPTTIAYWAGSPNNGSKGLQ